MCLCILTWGYMSPIYPSDSQLSPKGMPLPTFWAWGWCRRATPVMPPHMCLSKRNDRYVDVHSVHGLSASDAACRPCVYCVHLAVMCRQVRELTATGQSPNVKRRAHSRLWGGWYGSTRPCGAAARAGQVVPYSSFLGMGVRVIHSVHEPAGWGDL